MKNNPAQMLIEVIVAVGILALVLVGVSDLMTRSGKLVNFQKDKEEALSVARELVNSYKTSRDTDPDDFFDNVSPLSKDVCVEGKKYSCTVAVENITNGVSLLVKVYWYEGGESYYVSLSQALYKK